MLGLAWGWNMAGMIKTTFPGVRYREHKTRKHGIRADRYFFIRSRLEGKTKEEGAGWASEGMTASKAAELLSMLKSNIRSGLRPQSLAEMRGMAEEARQAEEKAARLAARASVTFAEFWEAEYLPFAAATKKERTVREEEGLYRRELEKPLGSLPVRDISPFMVERLAHDAQGAGKAAATVRHIVALIRQVWNLAASRGVVAGESPTKRVRLPKQDNRRMRFLTEEEARLLLEVLADRSMDTHDSAVLSLFAGLRAGEIHALTWGDVNLDAGTLYIRDPKNKVSRHAFITPEIRAMLVRRGMDGMKRGNFVFPPTKGQQRAQVSSTFERVVKELGFNEGIEDARDKVVFHSLRHTFASWLVQRGVPLYTVAELMGHTTLEMTKRYSHLAPDTMRAAAMGLSGILDKKPVKVIPFRKRSAEGSE